jgi:hypothetical protein
VSGVARPKPQQHPFISFLCPLLAPLFAPQILHQIGLKPQATEGKKHHGEAALLPAPLPARASTTTVNARPSSGSVAVPKRMT